jgi:hypothetical protein
VAVLLLSPGAVQLMRNSILARVPHSLTPLKVVMSDYAIAYHSCGHGQSGEYGKEREVDRGAD